MSIGPCRMPFRPGPRLRTAVAALAALAAATVSACGSGAAGAPSAPRQSGPTPSPGATPVTTGNPQSTVFLNEAGSTALLPYLQSLVVPLQQQYDNITLQPAAGGIGLTDILTGNVILGGADFPLTATQAQQDPGMVGVPLAVGGEAVVYNVPGVSALDLNGDVLTRIYQGKITAWNDPAVAALNPGATLPATRIVPLRRIDQSGDTYVFTQYLAATSTAWAAGSGTSVIWPAVTGELTASSNAAMVQTCHAAPGCLAYAAVSSQAAARRAGLGVALLQNRAGQYVGPDPAGLEAAAATTAAAAPADLRQTIVDADGAASYPIAGYEYIIASSNQPDSDTSLSVRTFLAWAIDPGQGGTPQRLSGAGLAALPSSIVPKARALIARIGP